MIDFGGATFEEEYHSHVISTRQYRAPEVLLDSGWTEKADVFSLGAILMELYTGDLLFQTHGDTEHLALIEKIIGPFTKKQLDTAHRDVLAKHFLRKYESGTGSTNSYQVRKVNFDSKEAQRRFETQGRLREIFDPRHADTFGEIVEASLRIDPKDRENASNFRGRLWWDQMRDAFF